MDLTDMVKPSLWQRQKRRDKRMDEEVIEVGRYQGGKKGKILREQGYKAFYLKNFAEQYPPNVSITPCGRSTHFDDNLGLLKKFLMTHVGQKWDDVFAKLNARLDNRSVQGQHIIGHIFDFVELDVKVENGKVVRKIEKRYIWRTECHTEHSFYVHPETGILCRWCPPKKEQCPKKARFKKEKEKRKWQIRAAQKTDKTPPKVVEIKQNAVESAMGAKTTWWRLSHRPKSVADVSIEPPRTDKQIRSEKWFNEHRVELNAIHQQKPKHVESLRLLFFLKFKAQAVCQCINPVGY
jgi:hypothetical protein